MYSTRCKVQYVNTSGAWITTTQKQRKFLLRLDLKHHKRQVHNDILSKSTLNFVSRTQFNMEYLEKIFWCRASIDELVTSCDIYERGLKASRNANNEKKYTAILQTKTSNNRFIINLSCLMSNRVILTREYKNDCWHGCSKQVQRCMKTFQNCFSL